MLRREQKFKPRFMKFVSQAMAIVIAIATVLTVTPSVIHAAAEEIPHVTEVASNNIDSPNAISVEGDSVLNDSGATSTDDGIVATMDTPDSTPLSYIGAYSENNGAYVYLNFSEDITINNSDVDLETFLRSKISVTNDGEHFGPLSDQVGVGTSPSQINLYSDGDRPILIGTNTLIKIASDTLKDNAGILNSEMILHVSPAVIQRTEISDDNHDVTITYNSHVTPNASVILKNNIYLLKGDDSPRKGLVESDTVSIHDGKLNIYFAEALSGSNSQIVIGRNSLKDVYGNVDGQDRITTKIQANVGGVDPNPADTTSPQLIDSYYTNSFNTLNLVFDEDIMLTADDVATLKSSTYWYNTDHWETKGLPSDTSVTFLGHTLSIQFVSYPGEIRYLQIFNLNLVSDLVGNKYKYAGSNYIMSEWIDSNIRSPFGLQQGSLSHDGRKLSLKFESSNVNNATLVDKTIVDGVSHLKEKITISLDHGVTFTALNLLDIVTIQRNELSVLLHEGIKDGSVQVRIPADVVSYPREYQRNKAVDQLVYNDTPEITGYLLSDVASEFIFTDNAVWQDKIKTVYIRDNNNIDRLLSSSDYKVTGGKLTFNKGLFQEGHGYELKINTDGGYRTHTIWGIAHKSSDIFYMTAPVVTVENGITATVKLFNNASDNYSAGTQTVIFELMNGQTPVSIVASDLKLTNGTYKANFNVVDAVTNSKYTVKAFVVSKYNNDPANVGLNLATVKTQIEIDQLIFNNNDNE